MVLRLYHIVVSPNEIVSDVDHLRVRIRGELIQFLEEVERGFFADTNVRPNALLQGPCRSRDVVDLNVITPWQDQMHFDLI